MWIVIAASQVFSQERRIRLVVSRVAVSAIVLQIIGVPEGWICVFIITQIHGHRRADLSHIRCTDDYSGLLARSLEGGEQHRDQQRDDADYDQKLDEGEAAPGCALARSIWHNSSSDA